MRYLLSILILLTITSTSSAWSLFGKDPLEKCADKSEYNLEGYRTDWFIYGDRKDTENVKIRNKLLESCRNKAEATGYWIGDHCLEISKCDRIKQPSWFKDKDGNIDWEKTRAQPGYHDRSNCYHAAHKKWQTIQEANLKQDKAQLKKSLSKKLQDSSYENAYRNCEIQKKNFPETFNARWD